MATTSIRIDQELFDKAIRKLLEDPYLDEQKKGDLSFLRVYKFKMVN